MKSRTNPELNELMQIELNEKTHTWVGIILMVVVAILFISFAWWMGGVIPCAG